MPWTSCAQREVLRMPFTMLALDSIEEIEGRADTRSNPQVGVIDLVSKCVFAACVRRQPFHDPRAMQGKLGVFLDKGSEQNTCSLIRPV
jgi:hypothetical protein